MDKLTQLFVMTALLSVSMAYAKPEPIPADFNVKAQQVLDSYYQQYRNLEYFSGAALSIYLPKEPIRNYYVGQISHEPSSQKITGNTLFQIGSITKSFTAAIILQLEKEGKLNIKGTIKEWLPAYPKWSAVTIEQLLNMTSGLPNYSDTPLWAAKEYQDPRYVWTNEELLSFVYPNNPFTPPLKTGYFYTNTGYILSDLIIEKAAHSPFSKELMNRTIKLANLFNTFYPVPNQDQAVTARMAHGYNYNQYDNPAIVGKDQLSNNLSWAAAAGGLVANTEDIIKWVKALFIDETILDNAQKKKLMSLVSFKDGKPVSQTTETDPRAFGLGVAQVYMKDDNIGRFFDGF